MQQRSRVFLLTFSASGPDIELGHLRSVGGFRMDQCYTTLGVRHRFMLLVLGRGLDNGFNAMERLMWRLRTDLGISPSNIAGHDSAMAQPVFRRGQSIWAHPGYRVMVDRQQLMYPCLKAWMGANLLCSDRLLLRCWEYTLQRKLHSVDLHGSVKLHSDFVGSIQHSPLVKCESVAASSPRVGCRRRRDDDDCPPRYTYVPRDNDDKWTAGWA